MRDSVEDLIVPMLVLAEYRELGVVDASVVALVERLGETKVATLDHRHFATIRPSHVTSLRLLP